MLTQVLIKSIIICQQDADDNYAAEQNSLQADVYMKNLLRKNIKNLKPYSSARDEFSGQGSYLFFDANENAIGSVGTELAYNRYPDPYQRTVKALIAEQNNINPDQIFLGNGSDEGIDLLFRAFCEPNEDKVIIMPPTYGMYQVSADINAVETVKVSLTKDYQPDVDEVINVANQVKAKLIFICSPNNPTGNLMEEEKIKAIIENVNAIVVVDEAYIDFAPDKSMIRYLNDYPNLVMLQTFSKAWGLANLRLGKVFASPEIIQVLNNIKPPYNVNGYTQMMGVQALQNVEQKNQYVASILKERTKLRQSLEQLDFVEHVYPSDANFLLLKVNDANGLYQRLIERNLVVRNRSKVHLCEGCLRITVGISEENEALVATLKNI